MFQFNQIAIVIILCNLESVGARNSPSTPEYRNHLETIRDKGLKNRYFAVRPGQSMTTSRGVISSDPNQNEFNLDLTQEGWEQANLACEKLIKDFLLERDRCRHRGNLKDEPKGILVVSSTFKRATEAAHTIANGIFKYNLPLVGYHSKVSLEDERLNERWFGEWNGKRAIHYQDVWKEDASDPYHTKNRVESVWSVLDRTTACVYDLEQKLGVHHIANNVSEDIGPLWIILVTDGDVLQILQTAFSKDMDPSEHQKVEVFQSGEPRGLELN